MIDLLVSFVCKYGERAALTRMDVLGSDGRYIRIGYGQGHWVGRRTAGQASNCGPRARGAMARRAAPTGRAIAWLDLGLRHVCSVSGQIAVVMVDRLP